MADVERSPKYHDIVVAAQELFGEVGYEKTSVREIAERAHIALGTLYSHFPDGKIGVLSAAMTERVERLTAFLADGQIEDPLAAFLDRVRRLNSEIVRDPFLRRVLLEQGHVYEPRLRERGQQLVDAFGALAVAELTRLTESGAAQCDDPQAVAVLIRSATVGWITANASGTATVSHDRLLEVLIDAVQALIEPRRSPTGVRRKGGATLRSGRI
ncbi:TetR/AcrR family transcriptional regulator [Mycolicibacterium fluoranthenivorans]|uniref:AcrR family transcriptional regulator n=1 Tax=Mycolicibacterium fluoranthenivorans TaxID=258505 RepID=A0A7X5ZEC1_9MYCO|nr:TetR/AcrR family transcriptional regulator [Mycolicibacterium fluoranthenivorans]MCV7354334.1 TetR/AcrR family transcriptional regulator [Mycolicibacterium fluoranthenivorans]NIH97094.1 AcrR family transcriptional regulator [Mycolicibacterium fluoranthenivorans]